MARLTREEKEFLERCPKCEEGYMVPTVGDWHECSECGLEAEENEYGVLMYDEDAF